MYISDFLQFHCCSQGLNNRVLSTFITLYNDIIFYTFIVLYFYLYIIETLSDVSIGNLLTMISKTLELHVQGKKRQLSHEEEDDLDDDDAEKMV